MIKRYDNFWQKKKKFKITMSKERKKGRRNIYAEHIKRCQALQAIYFTIVYATWNVIKVQTLTFCLFFKIRKNRREHEHTLYNVLVQILRH